MPPPPLGSGADRIVHAAPFHTSTNGAVVNSDSAASPTATQAVGAVQETPSKLLSFAPGPGGVDVIVQRTPFQDSASGTCVPLQTNELHDSPTATQAVEELHETPDSEPNFGLAAFGTACRVQRFPSARYASGSSWWAEASVSEPTATQDVGLLQDTPSSRSSARTRLPVQVAT